MVNSRETIKGSREEVAFELDLEGCLALDIYGFTGESTVRADTAIRNLGGCMVNNEH